jgi:hypothetical protein
MRPVELAFAAAPLDLDTGVPLEVHETRGVRGST